MVPRNVDSNITHGNIKFNNLGDLIHTDSSVAMAGPKPVPYGPVMLRHIIPILSCFRHVVGIMFTTLVMGKV